MKEEDVCPVCENEFAVKTTYESGRNFSVNMADCAMGRLCVYHMEEEDWVYIHGVQPSGVYITDVDDKFE